MRRTLLAVIVAAASFVATSAALVFGFELVVGRSTGPSQGASTQETSEPPAHQARQVKPTPAGSDSPAVPASSGDPAAPSGGRVPGDAGVGVSALPTDVPLPRPTPGALSEDFRKLGLDDPSTTVDESLRSACDVVGGTIAGPVLCADR